MNKEGNSLLVQIYDHLDEFIIVLDRNRLITYVNKAAQKYYGCKANDCLEQSYLMLCQYDVFDEKVNENFPGSAFQPISWSIVSDQLSCSHVLIGKLVIPEPPPLENIPAEDFLYSILTSQNNGVNLYWKDKRGKILLCNHHQAVSAGYSKAQDLIGLDIFEVGQKLNCDPEFIKNIWDNDQLVMNSRKDQIFEEEFIIAGKSRFFQSFKTPFINQKNELLGVLGISIDITLLKELEFNLKQSKKATDYYLECILMSCPSNIYWIDTKSRIIGCNDHQAKNFGAANRLDMIGKNIFDIAKMGGVNLEMAEKIRDHDLEVMKSRQCVQIEENCFIDGENKTFLSYKAPMFDEEGEVIGLLGISTDITVRKRAEQALIEAKQQAEELSHAKTCFIANVTHDIRTPLIGIYGIAEYLSKRIGQQYHVELDSIIKASQELLKLLNEIIDLTSFEAGIESIKPSNFDLLEVVTQLQNLFSATLKNKKLTFNLNYADDLPHKFYGKELLVHRVLLNLLANAIKFTHQGNITINISLDKNDKNILMQNQDIPIKIEIIDTGIGIPANKQKLIFEDFYRISPSFKGIYKGNGIGLSIVKQTLEKLGGKIHLKSEVGKGSTFSITFKLQKSKIENSYNQNADVAVDGLAEDELLQLSTSIAEKRDSPSLSGQKLTDLKHPDDTKSCRARVLLVEDHPMIQQYTMALFTEMNCIIDLAETGFEVLEKLKIETAYDLILMDIGLADINGFEVVKTLRENQYDIKTPIIALTAHMDATHMEEARQIGIKELITKPITSDIINRLLSQYVNKK